MKQRKGRTVGRLPKGAAFHYSAGVSPDEQGRWIYSAQKWMEFWTDKGQQTGRTQGELIKRPAIDLLHPDVRAALEAYMLHRVRGLPLESEHHWRLDNLFAQLLWGEDPKLVLAGKVPGANALLSDRNLPWARKRAVWKLYDALRKDGATKVAALLEVQKRYQKKGQALAEGTIEDYVKEVQSYNRKHNPKRVQGGRK